jgi:Ni2+-binding GTPase involved in maturation of urease and hydrogenase
MKIKVIDLSKGKKIPKKYLKKNQHPFLILDEAQELKMPDFIKAMKNIKKFNKQHPYLVASMSTSTGR